MSLPPRSAQLLPTEATIVGRGLHPLGKRAFPRRTKHIKLGPHLGAPVLLRADSGMIKQLLVNLINNAITHCPADAQITIDAKTTARGVCLSVEDNGPGIPPTERKRVLQPFVRLDGARTSPGSGLGLALVAAIADHHRASLDLEDAAPGLRVVIVFPEL